METKHIMTFNKKVYDAVEVATIVTWYDDGERIQERVESKDDCFNGESLELCELSYGIYLHLSEGGVECVAECEDADMCRYIAEDMAKLHFGDTVADFIIEV